ncbi:MAG TPA: aminotransferase class I/II-fold pyridoxal phosphate-dependent enzyme [Phycisphaerae bacterium]|nr:aminotransferase class I/II-fold pyridoxal phosphate-dependent enzyme [Phycisphaerae bacterium]
MLFKRRSTSSPEADAGPKFDPSRLISQRALDIDASGIRKVFDLAARLKDPINLSIGQPDFDVPEPIKERAIAAIRAGKNRYTPTQGIPELLEPLRTSVIEKTGWKDPGLLILSGTSGGIMLAMFAVLNPGDEVLILDPYFVMYKHLPRLIGAVPVAVDCYPDFRLHADRIEAAVTSRTKMLVLCSPNNPTGIAFTPAELEAAAAVARKHNLLVLSDEIYDAFCYGQHHSIAPLLPEQCVLLRGYSKTYAMTGWRLGYAAGPRPIIEQMTKLQQYTFVCAPSSAQYAALELLHAGHVDMTAHIDSYRRKRDVVVQGLSDLFEINTPGGAFYVFPKVPNGQTSTEFVARAINNNLLIIPGNVFSSRDTHFRLSYAASDETISRGIAVLRQLAREPAVEVQTANTA